jgi:uncharacterized damage-inducible protein DinB
MPARQYLIGALDHTPATLDALLNGEPDWNLRPDSERFSLREIVAHLADWESVWRERFERTINEEMPQLSRPDITQRSEDRCYATADPVQCLKTLREERSATTSWLRTLSPGDRDRTANLDRMGEMGLDALVALALAHDAYHLRQVAEWLAHRT